MLRGERHCKTFLQKILIGTSRYLILMPMQPFARFLAVQVGHLKIKEKRAA